MARIKEAELQHVKQAVSLEQLVRRQGHTLIKRGKELMLLCPFHQENTPSMSLSPSKNLYHCFGCGAAGSVLDWLMKTEQISLQQAYQRLCAEVGLVPELTPLAPVPSLAEEVDRQALLREVLAFYQQTLLTSPDAQRYLQQRGLAHPELLSQFKIGFANRTLGYRLPSKKLKEGVALRKQLQQLGLLRESGHEHFTGSIVIPVLDPQGQIGELYGRKLLPEERLRPGTPIHLYLSGPHRGVFNEQALLHHKTIILCESIIDALSFWVVGQRHVTAAYGVYGMTDDHWRLFADNGVRQVLIAFDNDQAGNGGARKVAQQLRERGIQPWRVVFPPGMDANDYLCAHQEPMPAFQAVLEQAVLMADGVEVDMDVPPLPEKKRLGRPAGQKKQETATTTDEAEEESSLPWLADLMEAPDCAETDPPPAGLAPAHPGTQAMGASGTSAALPESPQYAEPGLVHVWLENGDLRVDLGEKQWRLRGLKGAWRYAVSLKVNLQVLDRASGVLFGDNLDMLSARSRQGYARQAAVELALTEGELRRDLGRLLLLIENLAQESTENEQAHSATPPVSPKQQESALAWLQSPDLISRLSADLAACGVVGESSNLLAAYLAATSRRLDKPLAVLIQSSSAAGKSSLMDAVLNLMPPEERQQYSAMTGQSLFYLGETSLRHKILAIAEEEGVRQAAYALKLLQSEGELTIASTGKDEATGNLVTRQYRVEGPVMLMLTTTAIDVDEELLNRCLVLTVNESQAQTRAIHAMQRQQQTLEGLLMESERAALTDLHQNAQRLLKPLKVVNPYARQLNFISDKTRTRRDHMKYLTLIQSIALLHQYQRPVKRIAHRGQHLEYIEVTPGDIQLANRLAHELLGRSLDELPPQTRRLLLLIREMVNDLSQATQQKPHDIRFTRREIRAFTQWSDSQLKLHCQRLSEMEYLLVHSGSRGHLLYYELLWDSADPHETRVCGLIELAEPDGMVQASLGQPDASLDKHAGSLPQVGGRSGSSLAGKKPLNARPHGVQGETRLGDDKNAVPLKSSHPVSPSS